MGYCKLDTSGSWAVNGTPIYVPGMNIDYQHDNLTGSSTGRTQDGVMHIDWIRGDLRKVGLKYPAMTGDELRFILGLMQGKEFTFTFLDLGQVQTMQAYVGQSKYTLYSQVLDIYTRVEINVIEK